MSPRDLALDWSIDGPIGAAFLVLVGLAAVVYLEAAALGDRRDRRGRRWPLRRTACFLGGLLLLIVDLYSGIGTEADTRLSVHMVEHMVLWVLVAPLLAAGAPVRLAFYALPTPGRRVLARCLHSRAVSVATSPVVSISLFSAVVLITHIPAAYGLTLSNDYVHEAEHGLYLITALLVWAPLLGVDPFPRRPGSRGQLACTLACMVPMAIVALWLGSASHPLYAHYLEAMGPSALHDQRVAATIMWVGDVLAFAAPAMSSARASRQRRSQRVLVSS